MIALCIDLQRACSVKVLGWDAGYLYFSFILCWKSLTTDSAQAGGAMILFSYPCWQATFKNKAAATVMQFCKL